MNNTVIATDSIYARFHKIYRMSLTNEVIEAEMRWSWKKFKRVEVKPARIKYVIAINHSIYNEVTKKLENDTCTYRFTDQKWAKEDFKQICEQLKAQDPTLRYVDDALQQALEGVKND